MTCENVRPHLNAFLDNELAPSERARVQTHLQSCALCQNELAQRAATQSRVRATLHHQAAAAQPSASAWHKLAPRLQSSTPHAYSVYGAIFMRKPLLIGAAVAVLVLALLGVWMTQNATPVSAQEILNRSAQTQQTAQTQQGIRHTQTKIYLNPYAFPPSKQVPGEPRTTLIDSYNDPQTGLYRSVSRNADTNQITDVNGFDGLNLYTPARQDGVDVVTTLYRTPQADGVPEMIKNQQMVGSGDGVKEGTALDMSDQQLFEKMRVTPSTTAVTREQWENGRKVYVLHMTVTVEDESKLSGAKIQLAMPSALYFDAETYAVLGQAKYIDRDGKSELFYSSRIMLDETLPADTTIVWDMSDLTDITLVDDPNGQFGDQLPGPITTQELAGRNANAYLLSAVPDGFTLYLTAPPNPRPQEPNVYIADYRGADDNYFLIQGGMSGPTDFSTLPDSYTTRSGIKLYFESKRPPEKSLIAATALAPDGTTFLVTANLSREQFDQFAEQLVRIK